MGAPGYAWFCKQGHLYHWVDEHLWWDETLDKEQAKAALGCVCGETVVTSVCHYGDVGQCLDGGPLIQLGTVSFSRTKLVEGAHDGNGHPVTAYTDQRIVLPHYDVTALGFPPTG